MTFDFSKHNRRTVEVQFGDDTLSVTYKPSEYNEAMLQHVRDLSQEGKPLQGQADALERLIVEWDAVDGDQPIEPTAETFMRLGPHFSNQIYNVIWYDCLPENYENVHGISNEIMNTGGKAKKPTPIQRKKRGGGK